MNTLRDDEIVMLYAESPKSDAEMIEFARAALASQRAEVPQGAVAWLPFDYASPPDDGLMFVAVSAPETDCDVDDYGKTVGWHTGEVERSVALVHFSPGEGGEHDFQPVDSWNAGKVPAEGWVTHYMPVSLPKLPETAIAAYQPVAFMPPARAMSKTMLPDGWVKIEIGDTVLTLTPREDRMLGNLMRGAGDLYAQVDILGQAMSRGEDLATRMQRLERLVRGDETT